jgi:hypothetical protein
MVIQDETRIALFAKTPAGEVVQGFEKHVKRAFTKDTAELV